MEINTNTYNISTNINQWCVTITITTPNINQWCVTITITTPNPFDY
jgi:hypothetical protein